MRERESVNPDTVYGYCGCGNPIYRKIPYCSTCDSLLNQGRGREVFDRLSRHVDILTGRIYKQTVEELV